MRLEKLKKILRRRRLDAALVSDEANVLALTGVKCDNACVAVKGDAVFFFTDFRYFAEVRRVCPGLPVRDIKRLGACLASARRIGYESCITHAAYLRLVEAFPKAKFTDILADIHALRSVKTPEEAAKLRRAEALAVEIWKDASAAFRPGMTEREMARVIKRMMLERGEGEAFETIVCVGANAAECHHVPDDTVWNGREAVLVDMGVRFGGVCSDLTRNIVPKRASRLYRRVYDIVKRANRAAIAAVKPGMTAKALDRVARSLIAKEGFGKCFGHALGHGVGYEIHEAPTVSKRSDTVLEPGMTVTIEPGIYLEGNLGVRIEDLVLVTEEGCEVLSADR